MIGLDTNILIRYLTQDDPAQAEIANRIIEDQISDDNTAFITLVVLTEVVWVLESCYGQTKNELVSIIEQLLMTRQLRFEQAEAAHKSLRSWKNSNGDFSDALITTLSRNNGCNQVLTFDRKAISLGMTLAG